MPGSVRVKPVGPTDMSMLHQRNKMLHSRGDASVQYSEWYTKRERTHRITLALRNVLPVQKPLCAQNAPIPVISNELVKVGSYYDGDGAGLETSMEAKEAHRGRGGRRVHHYRQA